MAIDLTTPHGQLLQSLASELAERRPRMDLLESYYRGTNGIPVHANRAVSDAYKRLMAVSRLNLARLTVEATRERMQVLGVRTSVDSGELGDAEAWRIWQANSLDADHMLIDRAALTMSRSFAMVGAVDPEIGAPVITTEDPREVIVRHHPARRRKAMSGLKLYVDGDFDRAVFFPEPGWVLKAHRKRSSTDQSTRVTQTEMGGWTWTREPERLPYPIVPIIEFQNLAGLGSAPEGEFEAHLAALDRITFVVLNRLELLTLQAFRQRAIKGLPLKDPQTGEEIDYSGDFLSAPGELWQLSATAEIWESGAVDLSPILQTEKQDIVTYAGATATPLSYLFPDSDGGSAEGAALKRESATFKAIDRMAQQGEAYEQLLSMAFLLSGDTVRAQRGSIEIIWAAAERFTLAQKAEAAAKYAAAGVPLQTIGRAVLQMTPSEIRRMLAEQATEALLVSSDA